jgi:DNA-binding transcriptional ArsR family regulator
METQAAVSALSALAQETRLEVFRLLVEAGPAGLPAGEVASRLDIAPATLSFHLRTLLHAGLCGSQRNGRSIVYAANFEAMGSLLGYLSDNCCGGAPERCLPRAGSGGRRSSRAG